MIEHTLAVPATTRGPRLPHDALRAFPGSAIRHAHAASTGHLATESRPSVVLPRARAGAHAAVLTGVALLHLVLGILGVVVGVLVWYLAAGQGDGPVISSGVALGLAVCASVSLAYQGVDLPFAALCARLLLVVADLLAGAVCLWSTVSAPTTSHLTPQTVLLFSLLLLAPLTATILFSPRIGVFILGLGMLLVVVVNVATVGLPLVLAPTPAPTTHVLLDALRVRVGWEMVVCEVMVVALLGGCIIWCWSLAARSTERLARAYEREVANAYSQVASLLAAQEGLTQALALVQGDVARADTEYAGLLRQASAIAAVAEGLALGNVSVTRQLDPTLHGPLASLAGALGLVAQRVAQTTGSQAQVRQALAEKLARALDDQREAMLRFDRAVRQSSSDAEAIAAAFPQAPSPYASSLPRGANGGGEDLPLPLMYEVARLAAGHADRAAEHIAWLAQIQSRHAETQQTLAQLTRLLATPQEPAADVADTITLSAGDVRHAQATSWATSAVVSPRSHHRA